MVIAFTLEEFGRCASRGGMGEVIKETERKAMRILEVLPPNTDSFDGVFDVDLSLDLRLRLSDEDEERLLKVMRQCVVKAVLTVNRMTFNRSDKGWWSKYANMSAFWRFAKDKGYIDDAVLGKMYAKGYDGPDDEPPNYQQAVAHFNRSLDRLEPDSPTIGEVYRRLGLLHEARLIAVRPTESSPSRSVNCIRDPESASESYNKALSFYNKAVTGGQFYALGDKAFIYAAGFCKDYWGVPKYGLASILCRRAKFAEGKCNNLYDELSDMYRQADVFLKLQMLLFCPVYYAGLDVYTSKVI